MRRLPPLHALRAFEAAARHRHFARAAAELNVTATAVSHQVRQLEEILGVPLFHRYPRPIRLTPEGAALFPVLREGFDAVAAAIAGIAPGAEDRPLRCSVTMAFASRWLLPRLPDFSRQNPAIDLMIDASAEVRRLEPGGFDLAIRITRLEDSSLIAKRLSPFSIRICASPEFLEEHGVPTRPQDLASMPCIIDTNGRWHSNWPFAAPNGGTTSVAVTGPIEVNSPLAVRAAAVAGLGIAVIPDFIAQPEIDSGRLVSVLDEHVLTGAGIFAVYPHRRYLPAKIRVFVDFLAQWFKLREAA